MSHNTHTRTCAAHAIGCAVENLRDSGSVTESAVTVGMSYLTDGIITCYCHTDMSWAAKWVLMGLEALDTHDAIGESTILHMSPHCDYCGIPATYNVRAEHNGVITRRVCDLHSLGTVNNGSILEPIVEIRRPSPRIDPGDLNDYLTNR